MACPIDWKSKGSQPLVNPRHPEREEIESILRKALYPAHVWISTSGSTQLKWVGLSLDALLISAEAVNRHLEVGFNDSWIHVLPNFHVGGIGIWARSYLGGQQVYSLEKWDPYLFVKIAGTLSALVPAQVYDLVKENLSPQSTIRAVIVGGGALPDLLYQQATALGWPLLPSYGLTECASQVATACNGNPSLHFLSHITARLDEAGQLEIKSPVLFSTYATIEKGKACFTDPKQGGWFTTEDQALLKGWTVEIVGRTSDFIKIGGESVSLKRLQALLPDPETILIPIPDERLGHVLHLVTTKQDSVEVVTTFNATVLPFERIRAVRTVSFIPRSPLGKPLIKEIISN